jgi:hypothetical protein
MSRVFFDYEFIKQLLIELSSHSLLYEINNGNSQEIQVKINTFNLIKYYRRIYINRVLEKNNPLDLLIIKVTIPEYVENIEENLLQGDIYFSTLSIENIEKISLQNKCLVFNQYTYLKEANIYFSSHTWCIKKNQLKDDLIPDFNLFQSNYIKLQDPYFVVNCGENLKNEKEILSRIFKNIDNLTLVFNKRAKPRTIKIEGKSINFSSSDYEKKISLLKKQVNVIYKEFHNRNIISDYVIISSEYGFDFIGSFNKVYKTQLLSFVPIFQFNHFTKKFIFFDLKKQIEIF